MDEKLSDQDNMDESLASETLDQIGDGGEAIEKIVEETPRTTHMAGDGNSGKEVDLPLGVKERLGRQEKRHQRELREMRAQIQAMQGLLTQNQAPSPEQSLDNGNYGDPNAAVDEQIHKAVALALRAQDEQKRKEREREGMEHVNRRYASLHDDLNKASDKYEDFDDVVRAQDAPFSESMRDAALFLDNPAEVLYKLGKNKEELKRISKLHPLEQAREMVKLSHALMSGNGNKESALQSRPIGQVKSYPVNSSSVTDKTPVGEIRRRMKAGEWKRKA